MTQPVRNMRQFSGNLRNCRDQQTKTAELQNVSRDFGCVSIVLKETNRQHFSMIYTFIDYINAP